jgi:DNA-binding protein YbaB
LKTLLTSEMIGSRGLWDKYCQTQLKLALMEAKPRANDVAVTCAFCGKYSEFYVKADPDHWKNAEKERFKVTAAREEALYDSTKKMHQEMERRLEEFQKRAANQCCLL